MNPADLKEARIVYQNSLAHATKIEIYNAGLEKREVKVEDVIHLARQIAKEVLKLGKGE